MNEPTQSASIPCFDFSSGALCLDFANSWGDRSRPEKDRLGSYADLAAFAAQAECLDAATAAELSETAERQPRRASAVFRQARRLRDAIYRIFLARAERREIAAGDLEQLHVSLAGALGQQRLWQDGDRLAWTWATKGLSFPLWPVARSAAELLTSDEMRRVRQCDSDDCTWLFLDQSRSRSRRWCSMESCGNRAKARRHYERCRDR